MTYETLQRLKDIKSELHIVETNVTNLAGVTLRPSEVLGVDFHRNSYSFKKVKFTRTHVEGLSNYFEDRKATLLKEFTSYASEETFMKAVGLEIDIANLEKSITRLQSSVNSGKQVFVFVCNSAAPSSFDPCIAPNPALFSLMESQLQEQIDKKKLEFAAL
jgi:hypothetical protein